MMMFECDFNCLNCRLPHDIRVNIGARLWRRRRRRVADTRWMFDGNVTHKCRKFRLCCAQHIWSTCVDELTRTHKHTFAQYSNTDSATKLRPYAGKIKTNERNQQYILYSHRRPSEGFRSGTNRYHTHRAFRIYGHGQIMGHITKMNKLPKIVEHNMNSRQRPETNYYDDKFRFKSYCRTLHNVLHQPIGTCTVLPCACANTCVNYCMCVCMRAFELAAEWSCESFALVRVCECVKKNRFSNESNK